MHITKPALSSHRRQRLVLLTLAMLAWLASVLRGAPCTRAQLMRRRRGMSLAMLERRLCYLVVLRARALANIRRNKRCTAYQHGRDMRRPQLMRALVGSTLRRALRDRDTLRRIAKLMHAARTLETYAAHIAKRFKHGLTRRCFSVRPAPTRDDVLLASVSFVPLAADSS